MFFLIGFLFSFLSPSLSLSLCLFSRFRSKFEKNNVARPRENRESVICGASMVSRVEERIKSRAEPRFPP